MKNRTFEITNIEGRGSKPLVSVVTPILNGAKYLDQCIESVLSQDYQPIEHVFVDGGSTDGSVEIIQKYSQKYPDRVKLIVAPKSSACDAWNIGMKQANGKIFGWLGADDFYKPGAVSKAMRFFSEHEDAVFVFGHMEVNDSVNKEHTIFLADEFSLKKTINAVCSVYAPAAFWKREVVDKVGYLDPKYRLACDLDWFIRVGEAYPIHRIDAVLTNFRVHTGSVSGKDTREGEGLREAVLVARSHGCSSFAPRIRCYYFMQLTRRLGFLSTVYHNKVFRPMLSWAVERVLGEHRVPTREVKNADKA